MKEKVEIIYFKSPLHAVKNDKYSESKSKLTIEIRKGNKRLVYKNGQMIRTLDLTKKSYKNLKRFSSGITGQNYVEIENPRNFFNDESWEDDDDFCSVSYASLDKKTKKEKSPFIVQVFKCTILEMKT